MTVPQDQAAFEMPPLFVEHDRRSGTGQRLHIRATQLQILLLVIAAGSGAIVKTHTSGVNYLDVIAATAFTLAGATKLYFTIRKPEQIWFGGRAVAESIKGLAWKYSTGGQPFPKDGDADPDVLFAQRVRDLVPPRDEMKLGEVADPARQITPGMRNLRARSLDERRGAYLRGRIDDQKRWYRDRALYNDRLATIFDYVIVSSEFAAGIAIAILAWVARKSIDPKPIAAILIAMVVTWTQTRQYHSLANAYSMTVRDIDKVSDQLGSVRGEEAWAEFVDGAEQAFSREHKTWRSARRSGGEMDVSTG